jgi:hypothetical protein
MDALPALVRAARYGSVRRTDASLLLQIVNGLVARICVGLPPACVALDDDSASEMYERIVRVNGSIALLQDENLTLQWRQTLIRLAEHDALHGLIRGRAVRILRDVGQLSRVDTAGHLRRALSTAVEPAQAAAWLDGFLRDSGALLLHDEALWHSLDRWVSELAPETFEMLLPLLRRTFSTFHAPERRQMGERARAEASSARSASPLHVVAVDTERAARVLPILRQILSRSTIHA